jgi:catechol 2,3-dioxygenase-like lactoylglutathione lyase family enzyme
LLAASLLSAGPATAPADAPPPTAIRPYLLALTVAKAEASAAWYRDRLGFRELSRGDYPEHGLRIIFLERDGFRLELIENSKSFPITRHVPGYRRMSSLLQGVSKMAFRVDNADALAGRLKAEGVTFLFPLSTDGRMKLRHFIVADPDGNPVQFVQPLA